MTYDILIQPQPEGTYRATAFSEHPWLPFLGMWKNDPTFDDLLDQIKAYRRELDETVKRGHTHHPQSLRL